MDLLGISKQKETNMKKRVLSMILAVVLLLTCVPLVAVAAETTTITEKVDIVSLTYKSWRSQLSAANYEQRTWDNNTLMAANKDNAVVAAAADQNKGGGIAYKAQSRDCSAYYPSIYLNDEGKLVRDDTYKDQQVDVNLNDYLANGLGKYYGYYVLELAELVKLDSFRVYNNNGWWHLNGGFDVLVSENGETWTKKASYTGMGNHDKWDSKTNYVSIDGGACVYVDVAMDGANAKYVAVAVTAYAGGGNNCALWYAEATKRVEVEVKNEATVSTVEELKSAIAQGNATTDFTIYLDKDIVCANDTNFGTLSGTGLTIDGQGHTIYNLRDSFAKISGAGITVKNLIISNKVSEGGAEMDLKGGIHIFGSTWDKLSGGTAERPVVIENVVNQRNVSDVADMSGLFARTVGGYVIFKDCVNEGNITAREGNYKIGGFVGALEDSGIVLTFDSCVNKGNVTSSQAGGFVGVNMEGAGNTIKFVNSTNSGTITALAGGSNGCRGTAGGFMAGINNANNVSANIFISFIGCQNNGDVVLKTIGDNDWGMALGGLIGHAGNHPNSSKFEILIDNCAVYDCAVDAANEKTNLKFYAAGFVGKISPQANSNVKVLVKNSYLSKVSIAAVNARKFVGVGSFSVNVVTAENCVVYDLVETNKAGEVVEWNASAMAGCTRTFSADATNLTGFADTDADDMISAGGNGAVQTDIATGSTNIRFIATLSENVDLEAYEKVGFYVVALTSANTNGATDRVWIKSTDMVYNSLLADNVVTTAGDVCEGAGCLFTSEIQGIEQMIGKVDFYVTPYVIANDGSITFGQSYTTSVDTGSYSVNPIKLLSYNLKDGDYNGKSAVSRKSSLASVVKGQEPEIVCLQELGEANDFYHFTASSFASACNNTTYAYHQAGTTAVMWNSSLYTKLESGYVDCSVSSGGDGYSRECAWVKLKRVEDGAVFYVVSAHFDMNKPNDSASILANYFSNATRVIVAGDFNADETRKSVQNTFTSASYINAYTDFTKAVAANSNLQDDWNHDADGYPAAYGLDATFTNGTILDWCYAKGGFNVSAFKVVTSAGTTASDHYPISAALTLK